MKVVKYAVIIIVAALCNPLGGKSKYKSQPHHPQPLLDISTFIRKTLEDANPNLHVGIEIYSLTNNTLLYANNAHKLFVPASNTKIITAAATLHHLGTDYKFPTTLLTDKELQGSIIAGSLYLKGSGDPSLTDTDLEKLVLSLKKQGIKEIRGTICIDATEFDESPFSPGSFIDDIGTKWSAPIDALTLNQFNTGVNQRNYWQHLPRHHAAQTLSGLLRKHGIAYKGKPLFKKTPHGAHQLAVHYSEPLKDLVTVMMKTSDNLYADCFFKKLGAVQQGAPSTWKKSRDVVKQFLQDHLNILPDDLLVYDGAGSSRYNSMAPHHLAQVLIWAHKQPFAAEFLAALPTSGVDGSIQDRMKRIPGRVKAKTGNLYLSGASSLSGYVENHAKERFVFSIIINGIIPAPASKNYKHCIEDAIASFIANSQALS